MPSLQHAPRHAPDQILHRFLLTLAGCFGLMWVVLPLAHVRAPQTVFIGLTIMCFVLCFLRAPRALADLLPGEIGWPLLGWTLICTASSLWALAPLKSLSQAIQSVWLPGVCFLAALWLGSMPRTRAWSLRGWVAGHGLLCIATLSALALGHVDILQVQSPADLHSQPLFGAYPGPGLASTFVLLALPVIYWAHRSSMLPTAVGPVLGVLLILTGAASFNRMFWPGLAVVGLILAAFHPRLRRHLLNRGRAMLLGILILFGGVALILGATIMRFHSQPGAAGDIQAAVHDLSRDPRLSIWRNWFEAAKQHPILGTGYGKETAADAYANELSRYTVAEMDPTGRSHPHNLLISIWVQTGIPGLLGFLCLFACLLRHALRLARESAETRHVAAACLALICVMLAKNMTDDFYDRIVTIVFWSSLGLMLGHVAALRAEARQ